MSIDDNFIAHLNRR